jgi:hypothetical protein
MILTQRTKSHYARFGTFTANNVLKSSQAISPVSVELKPSVSEISSVSFCKVVQTNEVEFEVNLRPTVGQPVCLGVGLLSGAHDQIFVFGVTIAGFLMWGTLSDVRMGL